MKKVSGGYTLIELLLFMGLMSFMLVFMTDILTTILDTRRESESTSAVEQDGNYLLNRFSYDIAQASSINTPAAAGASSPTLDITINSISNVYGLSNNNVELTNNSGTDVLNGFNTTVSGLNFTHIALNTVQLVFTITSKTLRANGPEVRNYQTTIGIR